MRETLDLLGAVNLPERVTTLVYLTDSSEFPINRLRNLGIRNIQTSHFMVLDMDLMLSRNLNEELEKLPAWLKRSSTSAPAKSSRNTISRKRLRFRFLRFMGTPPHPMGMKVHAIYSGFLRASSCGRLRRWP